MKEDAIVNLTTIKRRSSTEVDLYLKHNKQHH